MTLARDDYSLSSVLDTLKTNFIKTGTVEKKDTINKNVSDLKPKESEINDVYEKNFNTTHKAFEEIQEKNNALELKNKTLNNINSRLEKIKDTEENNQNSDSMEKNEETDKKISELITKISEKQKQVAELQKKLYNEVNSLVELDEFNAEQTEELKQSVIKEIKENPEKSQKIHVKTLNRDLLLAMVSLHS